MKTKHKSVNVNSRVLDEKISPVKLEEKNGKKTAKSPGIQNYKDDLDEPVRKSSKLSKRMVSNILEADQEGSEQENGVDPVDEKMDIPTNQMFANNQKS